MGARELRPETLALRVAVGDLRRALTACGQHAAEHELSRCAGLGAALPTAREIHRWLSGCGPVVRHLVDAGWALASAGRWSRGKECGLLFRQALDEMRAEIAAAQFAHLLSGRAA